MKVRTIILLSSVCLLLLSSCGSTDTAASTDESGLKKYSGIGFTLKAPAAWEQVDVTKISAPIRGKFELAMRSTVNKRGFMNNITIISDTLMAEVSSGEYARQSMSLAAREYLSMKVVSDEVIKFSDGSTSQLGIFHAKYNEVTEEHLFFQTAKVCDKTVYLMTIGLSNDVDSTLYDQYRNVLESFTCVTPKK